MGNVLLDYNPDYSLSVFCDTDESRAVIKKELFEGREWVMGDLGLITKEERHKMVEERIPEKYRKEFKNVSDNWDICMVPLDGAKEFCNYLKINGYKIYILSNASTEFYTYFTRHFSLDFFDGYTVSCDIHIIKPDERIYRHILEKYGLKAEECVFVDDRQDNVSGAEKVGINGFVFKNDFEKLKNYIKENAG